MPQNIHVFETRNINYLKQYVDKAKSLGFNITVTNNSHTEKDKLFKEFISVYKHNSVNSEEFEIACFARYFAIASILKNDDPFFLTDTDVFISNRFRDLQGSDFKGMFVGSEGFDASGSEEQISPHCSVWNRSLLLDFLDFTINTYKKNHENGFLKSYYESRLEKYVHTAISDMNLIYLWIKENKIPYINSNSTKFELGIDHNISSLICENGKFKSFAGRKQLKISGSEITCFLDSGKEQNMALLHFQGAYKGILKKFYDGNYAKFIYFTLKNNYKHNGRIFRTK
jgi:hypothetical protein